MTMRLRFSPGAGENILKKPDSSHHTMTTIRASADHLAEARLRQSSIKPYSDQDPLSLSCPLFQFSHFNLNSNQYPLDGLKSHWTALFVPVPNGATLNKSFSGFHNYFFYWCIGKSGQNHSFHLKNSYYKILDTFYIKIMLLCRWSIQKFTPL